jgi:glycosyltransferase involved in cell wall biosynthesis
VTDPLPLFSIIIPTHSRRTQLSACLDAVQRLRYPATRFEVIVVDDGSDPPVEGVEAQRRGRLDVTVLRQSQFGPAAARNAGAARAKGEFLAFTDDDCMPEPEWLRALAAHLVAHADHMVGGRTINALPDNPYATASQEIIDVVYRYYNVEAAQPRFFTSNNLALSAEGFRAIGGFDPAFKTSEDRELCDRWLHRGGTLAYVADARVLHAHPLTLGSFWRQHFRYGRGAFRFYALRLERGSGSFLHTLDFYGTLLTHPFSEGPIGGMLARLLLVVVSQAASTAGFLREGMSAAGRPARRRKPETAKDLPKA